MGVRMARQVLFEATDVGFAFFDARVLEVRADVRMAEIPDRIERGLRSERGEHVCVRFVDVESRVFPSALIEIISIEAFR